MRLILNNLISTSPTSHPLMSTPASATFELRGLFCGFFRDVFGKRRMVLRVDGEELYLKVPKELREQLAGQLPAGEEIVATGMDESGGRGTKRVVSSVRSASGAAICAVCPILVCTKKNCWRSGGRELWSTLERHLEDAGLADAVTLKGVDCLDHCKHAPNAEWQDHSYQLCGPRDAAAIVARVAAETGTPAAR